MLASAVVVSELCLLVHATFFKLLCFLLVFNSTHGGSQTACWWFAAFGDAIPAVTWVGAVQTVFGT